MGGNDADVVHRYIYRHLVDIQQIRPMVQFPGTLSKYASGFGPVVAAQSHKRAGVLEIGWSGPLSHAGNLSGGERLHRLPTLGVRKFKLKV